MKAFIVISLFYILTFSSCAGKQEGLHQVQGVYYGGMENIHLYENAEFIASSRNCFVDNIQLGRYSLKSDTLVLSISQIGSYPYLVPKNDTIWKDTSLIVHLLRTSDTLYSLTSIRDSETEKYFIKEKSD